jgi:CBS domain-containing protein
MNSNITIKPDEPLIAAVRAIECSRRRIAVVVDAEHRLLGTLTDGDVRRCLLAGGNLQTPLSKAMNLSPLVAEEGAPAGYLLDLMRKRNVMALPVVDGEGRFKRLVHLKTIRINSLGGSTNDGLFDSGATNIVRNWEGAG